MDDLGNFVSGSIAEVDEIIDAINAREDYCVIFARLSNLRDNLSHVEGTLKSENRI